MPRQSRYSAGSSASPEAETGRTNMRQIFAEVARRRASHFAEGAGASTLAADQGGRGTSRRRPRNRTASRGDSEASSGDGESSDSGEDSNSTSRTGARSWPGPFATGLAILRERRRAMRRRAKAIRRRREAGEGAQVDPSNQQRRRIEGTQNGSAQLVDKSSDDEYEYDEEDEEDAGVDPEDEASFVPVPMWTPRAPVGAEIGMEGGYEGKKARERAVRGTPPRAGVGAPFMPGHSAVPTLVELCVRFVGALFDHVEELGPLPNALRRSIARSLALRRRLDGRSVRLLCDAPCDELVIPDGAALPEHQLVSLFRGLGDDVADPIMGAGAGGSAGPARAVEGLDAAHSASDALQVEGLPPDTALQCVSLHNCGRALTDRAARQIAQSVPWTSGSLRQVHIGGAYQLTDKGMLALLRAAHPAPASEEPSLSVPASRARASGSRSGRDGDGRDEEDNGRAGVGALSFSCCSLLRGPVAAHLYAACPRLRALSIDACAGLADDELAGSCDESNAVALDLASLSAMTDVRTDSDAVAGMSRHVVRAKEHEAQQGVAGGKDGSGRALPPALRPLPKYAGVLLQASQLQHLSLSRLAAVTDALLVPLFSRLRRSGQLRSLVVRDVPRCGDASILALCLGISGEEVEQQAKDSSQGGQSATIGKSSKTASRKSSKHADKVSSSPADGIRSSNYAIEALPDLPLELLELSALPRLSADALRAVAASRVVSRVRHLTLSRLNAIPADEEGPLVSCICACGHYGTLATPEDMPQQLPPVPLERELAVDSPRHPNRMPQHDLLMDPPAVWSPEIIVPTGPGTVGFIAAAKADEQLAVVSTRATKNQGSLDARMGFRPMSGLVTARFAGLRCLSDRALAALALTSPLTLRAIDLSWCRRITDAGVGYLNACCGYRLVPSKESKTEDIAAAAAGTKRSRSDGEVSDADKSLAFADAAETEGLREISCWGQSQLSDSLVEDMTSGGSHVLQMRGRPGGRIPVVG